MIAQSDHSLICLTSSDLKPLLPDISLLKYLDCSPRVSRKKLDF